MSKKELEKTQRMNLLMDCYLELLTDKQQEYLTLYYSDDLSLSEIANDLGVSRNAVHDNLSRAGHILEEYESKLHLLEKHKERLELIDKIKQEESNSRESLYDYLEMLKTI